MNNKILCKCLPFFLSLVLVFGFTLNVSAADSGGSTQMWNGDLFFHDQNFTIPLLNSFSNEEMINEDGDVLQRFKVASFNGSVSNLLQLTGTVGTYLNGVATTSYTFTSDAPYEGILSIGLTDGSHEGLTVSASTQSYVNNQTVVKVFVTFNNFEITSETMYFPIQFDVSYASRYDEVFMVVPYAVSVSAVGNDWTDQIAMYTSMEDLPGSKGVMGSIIDHISTWFNNLMDRDLVNHKDMKNHITSETANITATLNSNTQTMTNQSQSNSNAQIEASNTNSENEIANANANSMAEINQSKENTNNLMNGFDDDVADATATKIDFGLADFENNEEMFLTVGKVTLDGFSFVDTIPEDISNSLGLLGTLLQSIFEASGSFGFIVACSFSFIVFRMISGQTKFL